MHLNSQQLGVVNHKEGPALVIAGAGSGKTRVLTHRAIKLVEDGADPNRILLITFTRKAANELKERVDSYTGGTVFLSWCGTFHGTAARLLRKYGHSIGLDNSFAILDEGDMSNMLWSCLTDAFSKEERKQLPARKTLSKLYSYWVNTRRPLLETVLEVCPDFERRIDDFKTIFAAYAERKYKTKSCDYDDLLLHWLTLLEENCIPPLFQQIMIDEYQDTNLLQGQILEQLSKLTRNIVVVGDDAQSIYSFRGATVDNILHFQHHFPEAAKFQLEQNYRSDQRILDMSNALLAEASEGFKKELFSKINEGMMPVVKHCSNSWDEAEEIADLILQNHNERNIAYAHQAVIFRSSNHSFQLETKLNNHCIPFIKIGGIRFAESAHNKDVFAFLRCAESTLDETAWRRVFELFPGIGPANAARLYNKIAGSQTPCNNLLEAKFPKAAIPLKEDFIELMRELYSENRTLIDNLQAIIDFYKPLLAETYQNYDERLKEIGENINLAQKFGSRKAFLDEVSVGDNSVFTDKDEKQDLLTLTTMHSAKGCEWDHVYILDVVEGSIPSPAAYFSTSMSNRIEEERRMLYVAMTRAKKELRLYVPAARSKSPGAPSETTTPSHFLSETVLSKSSEDKGSRLSPLQMRLKSMFSPESNDNDTILRRSPGKGFDDSFPDDPFDDDSEKFHDPFYDEDEIFYD